MGKIDNTIEDKLISPIPDRTPNRILIYRAPNGELTIHFRNLKIVLQTKEEVQEWKRGFKEALKKFREGDYFRNDI